MGWNMKVLESIDMVILALGTIAELFLFIIFISNAYFCGCGTSIPPSPVPSTNKTQSTINEKSVSPSDSNTEQEMYEYTQRNKMQNIPRIYKILTSLSLFCGFITVFAVCLYHVLRIYYGLDIKFISCTVNSLPIITLFIQRLTLWLYFIYRIEITFKDSIFSMNTKKLTILKIFICTNGILVNLFYFIYIEINHCGPNSNIIGLIPDALNDVFISVVTLILFINRLKKVMKLNMDQKSVHIKLKRIIKKLSILVSVSISTTICLMAFFIIIPLIGVLAIDVVINSLCLLLSFIYYTKYYNTMCYLCIKSVDGVCKSKSPENNTTIDV